MKTLKILSLILLVLTIYSFVSCGVQNYNEIIDSSIKKYNPKRKDYVIIIDYNKSILSERLYVIDVKTKNIVIKSTVSHAFNSGTVYATDFSNVSGTNKSCIGVFQTENTKIGSFGYSMIIKGLDYGVNNNAKSRSIIFHSNTKMKTYWSNGCFATDEETNKKIIDLTKNGCLVIVLADNK